MFPLETFSFWMGLALLLGLTGCPTVANGERLAVQKCNEYRQITITTQLVIPLTMFSSPILFSSNNCTNNVKLIVGGEEASYGEFPHHALLGYPRNGNIRDPEFKCGGTLISEQHVLTAAHCFAHDDPTVVRLGEYDTTFSTGEEYDVDIATYVRHPKHMFNESYHDIALIKLAYRVYFTNLIRPACLWESEHRNITKFIATGFGYTEAWKQKQMTKLMKVQLEEYPVKDCATVFKRRGRFRAGIQDGQLCVGSIVEGRDTCQGDSGGPLQVVTNPDTCMHHVVGITSTGSVCGVGQAKAIYTKVSHYIDWIEDNVWGINVL